MVPPPSINRLKDLPVHLIHQKILPRLPFKYLNRCKCISKEMYSLISTDAEFAAEQSCSADTSSSGLVYMTRSGLSFFSNKKLVGVPDPSLDFLNPNSRDIILVSSTNGLLLLFGEFRGKMSLCVCNPATKDTAFVPNVVGKKYCRIEMGLVYDPCKLPDRFTIVAPLLHKQRDGLMYKFDIFRSDTGKWTRSSQSIYLDTISEAAKALCAKGVIYWCCGKYILWYDVKRDIAGSLSLPVIEGKVIKGVTDVGIYAGEITCCRAWSGGIEVWTLTRGSHWDRIHAASWDSMVDALDFCLGMQLRHKSLSDIFYKRRIIRPVGFDGHFVYIAVRVKYEDKTEKLFSWETKTGRVEKKGVITIIGSWRADQAFNYANSMARVPQIFNVST
ncbi:F-box protein [Carex littledalei]|uniref:F-box protein n=1 Tax=Carex littledalei TaxID=544730 RepID=A0A833RX18_9POAL|nr:F-box protein [Carex littledalei]